jgi:hypothetical protein
MLVSSANLVDSYDDPKVSWRDVFVYSALYAVLYATVRTVTQN